MNTLASENALRAVLGVKPPVVAAVCVGVPVPTIAAFFFGSQPLTATSVETSAADARGRNAIRFSRSLSEIDAPDTAAFLKLYLPSASQKR